MRKNFGVKPWFYPLPVLIIGTYNEDGTPNAMNAAWGGLYGGDQVVLCLSRAPTTRPPATSRHGVPSPCTLADAAHVVPADYVGLVSGRDQPDKLAKAGLHGEKSPFVDAPLLKEFPVALECKLVKITEEGNLIGQIVNVSADEAVLGADGKIDFAKFRPIAYEPVHNGYHVLGERVGSAFQDGAQLK